MLTVKDVTKIFNEWKDKPLDLNKLIDLYCPKVPDDAVLLSVEFRTRDGWYYREKCLTQKRIVDTFKEVFEDDEISTNGDLSYDGDTITSYMIHEKDHACLFGINLDERLIDFYGNCNCADEDGTDGTDGTDWTDGTEDDAENKDRCPKCKLIQELIHDGLIKD